MPIEVLDNPAGRPGVEKVLIQNNEWVDFYCGLHIHELRHVVGTVPYDIIAVADVEQIVTLPVDFRCKLVRLELKHTLSTNADADTPLYWWMSRSRELNGDQVHIQFISGLAAVSDIFVEFNDRYTFSPSTFRIGFTGWGTVDRLRISMTVQVMY